MGFGATVFSENAYFFCQYFHEDNDGKQDAALQGYCIFRDCFFCQCFHEYVLIKAWYPRLAMFLTMTPIIHQLDQLKFRNTIQGFDNGQQHLVSIVKSFGKCFLSIVRLEYRVAPKWYA